ncbi:MAG TPA: glutamate racemase [Balneolaceae bacterium]|nr:glutamate racemase [Balneolaceae bacterium]
MKNRSSSIGIFDSGVGGLTVAKAVQNTLPHENIIYFGDTARVPYGIKSEETVRKYALQIVGFLLEKNVKMILIACNTVSASAREEIEKIAAPVPVLDVITSGVDAALKANNHAFIGVIGTLATIGSNAYEKAITAQNSGVNVISKACPLLVPLAEEGWVDNEIARQVIHQYLQSFAQTDIDNLILGCTHYPLFKKMLREELHDPSIHIIDSATTIANASKQQLKRQNLLNNTQNPIFNCYVSDRPQRFQELAERFMDKRIENVIIEKLG